MLLPTLLIAATAATFQSTNPEALGQHLRYQPQDNAFVRVHGNERFNRPLYGGNTAFRVDGGDIPEFVLYLPGRGGNIRFAIQHGNSIKWIHNAESIESSYIPGSLNYRIQDPILSDGSIDLTALGSYQSEAFLVKIESHNLPADTHIIAFYGGLNGQKGKRGGDIGTEAVPISEWFQLKPEFCADNSFAYSEPNRSFQLTSLKGSISGLVSQAAQIKIFDAAAWSDPHLLLAPTSDITEQPLIALSTAFEPDQPVYFAWQKPDPSEQNASTPWTPNSLAKQFAQDEATRLARSSQLSIDTPDPFLNAAVAALCIGSDATWDEPQQAVMHGAIAWRRKLLGWRGPYAMDALGWHDRARAHLQYWASPQDTSPIPDALPGPDEEANLARSEAALHTNGTMSKSHYDMNLVYIDALFRHLRWTGDITFGKSVWPVIQRHLDWERRSFRRVYKVDDQELPLYEAYAAIWASDELSYNGGGVAYTSAYNAFHNREAAKLAALIGEDPTPYLAEAEAIETAMRTLLWFDEKNAASFAEYKDWIGLQRIHQSSGLWNTYHVIDSQVATPAEAYQMTRYIDKNIPSHTIQYPELVEPNPLWVFSTSHFFPYHWSVNNVVMGENLHTALAYWQAGRPEEAWSLAKGSFIASMFAGICPGNVGSMNFLDAYRGESQRDFADGSGVMSRAIVEGLFGIQPDLLAGRIVLRPGFPDHWDHASLQHSSISLDYQKSNTSSISLQTRFAKPAKLVLQLPLTTDPLSLRINGSAPTIKTVEQEGHGYLEATVAAATSFEIQYANKPRTISEFIPPHFTHRDSPRIETIDWSANRSDAPTQKLDLSEAFNAKVSDIFVQEYRSPRSPFVSLALPKQGIGGWAGAYKTAYTVDDRGLRQQAANNGEQILLPNGLRFATPSADDAKNIIFVSQWDNYPTSATIPAAGQAQSAYLLLAGSTNWMQSHIDNGVVIFHYTDGTSSSLALHNPTTWWPIDQDYYVGNFQFQHPGPYPLRLDLANGQFREVNPDATPAEAQSHRGGSATVLSHKLDPSKTLQSVELKALSNEVIIGLMALTLEIAD